MFTIDQLKEANSKVQSGADFPAYVQDLIKLGVSSYHTYVKDGHTDFIGQDNFQLQTEGKYPDLKIADQADPEKFKAHLKMHQQGKTHYLSFCKHAAESGVEKWIVDTNALTCTYVDKKGNTILKESIPSPQKTI
jgi:uncharacterized protein YbcV (DUF1398 family)